MGTEESGDFIQTARAIKHGNSGGAPLDAAGRLVGICQAILSSNGGNQGAGFTVLVNFARSVTAQILKKRKVERGYLVMSIEAVTLELRKDVSDYEGVVYGRQGKEAFDGNESGEWGHDRRFLNRPMF